MDMQNVETTETSPSFDQPASEASFASGLNTVTWGVIISAVAGVAVMPVLTAVIGQTETFDLIAYPALLIGGIIGASSVLAAGLVRAAVSATKSARSAAAERRGNKRPSVRGRLAMD